MWIALIVICGAADGCVTLSSPPLQSRNDCLVAIYDHALTLPPLYPSAASIDAWCVPMGEKV